MGHDGAKMGHDGAKMGHDSAKMGHDSAKMGHDGAKMGILSSTWEALGLESEKHRKTAGFHRFFALLGGSEEVSEASWGLSWTMLARRVRFSEDFWTCWREDGEQERQDGDMIAPRGAMIAPRWGMIAPRWAF